MLEEAFRAIPLTPGTRDVRLKPNLYQAWFMRVRIPEVPPGERKPLVLALHWAGGGDLYQGFHQCLAEPGLADLDAFIISPDAEFQIWYSHNNREKVLTLVRLAMQYWPVDTTRILVTGYSNGGNGAWWDAEKHPELFTAGIPMGSSYEPGGPIRVPLYVIHGAKDELFPLERTKAFADAAVRDGAKMEFVVNEQLSHYVGCAYVEELKRGVAWVERLWSEGPARRGEH